MKLFLVRIDLSKELPLIENIGADYKYSLS